MEVVDTSVRFVNIHGVGGFPVSNINYWRVFDKLTDTGPVKMLCVYFKEGGFIELPEMSEEDFAAQVFIPAAPF